MSAPDPTSPPTPSPPHPPESHALEDRLDALEAFVSFAEAAGTLTEVERLVRQAHTVFRSFFRDSSAVYYERVGAMWQARVWTEDIHAELLEVILAGLSVHTPVFASALEQGEASFVEHWNPEREGVSRTEAYTAAAVYPLRVLGEVRGMLTLGFKQLSTVSERDRGVVRAVGRSLTLALERAAVAERQDQDRRELEARTLALEAFVRLVGDLSLQADPLALVRRAQEIVMGMLPPGVALYYEPEDALWRMRSQVGELMNPALQAAILAGLPFDSAGNLLQPWQSREPYYQDLYDLDTDQLRELVSNIGATACLPILVEGQPIGVFAVALFGERRWTPLEKGVLETVARSLGLTIEGGRGVRRLSEQTVELERSNRELEQFAYVASHDLKEPLRSIVGFSQLLHKRYAGKLDARADQYLDLIQESSDRMNQLIGDLLAFSRVNTVPRQVQVTDALEAAHRVQRDLRAALDEAGASLEIGPLPRVQVDPTQLGQVLQNLIGNALKFRDPQRPLEVRVWADEDGERVRFAVQDNGIGIEPQYFERIFLIFQRLHTRQQYPGSGIGLALARKIVEGHGGRLWLESTPGVGSTFYFTLPGA